MTSREASVHPNPPLSNTCEQGLDGLVAAAIECKLCVLPNRETYAPFSSLATMKSVFNVQPIIC